MSKLEHAMQRDITTNPEEALALLKAMVALANSGNIKVTTWIREVAK